MTASTPTPTGVRPWWGVGLLLVAVLMIAVDMTVLFLAIPSIVAELSAGGTEQLWILHAGELVGAGLVLTAGRAVDRFGARRLLAMSLLAYAAASLLASLAVTVEMLIAARVLLGAATVSVLPAAMVLTRQLIPDARRFATAVSLLMAAFSAGMALGPLVGGVLLQQFWWGAVFLVNVPVALLVLAGTRLLPQVPGSGGRRMDLVSVGLSLAGLAGIVYGGQELAARHTDPLLAGAVLLAGLVAMAGFIGRQRHLAEPLLDLRLFASAPFTLSLLAIWVVILADVGAEVQLAQHLQVVLGLDPLRAGLVLAVPAVVSVATTAAAPLLLRWLRSATVIGLGAAVAVGAALGVLMLAQRPDLPLVWLVVAVSLVAAGMAPAFALATVLVLESAPSDQTGSAQSVQDASGGLGNTVGLALGGSVALLTYSARLDDTAPEGLSAAERERSQENLAGALEVADRTPGPAGDQLRQIAVDAFAGATAAAYGVAALGFGLVLVLALALRRSIIRASAGAPTRRR